MKKIFTILLALSALSIVMSGCSKPAEEGTEGTKTEGTEPAKTEEGAK